MGKLLGLLGGQFGVYILIAVAVLFAGMATTIYVQGARIDAAQADSEKWKASSKTLQADGAAKDVSIDELRKSLAAQIANAEFRSQQVRDASKHLATLTGELQSSITRIHALEESDRALPDCVALMRLDAAGVCPARIDGMRRRSARPPAAANH